MSDIAKLDQELNQLVLQGRILDAFDKFYADDVVMQENVNEPYVGKAVNRKREEEFLNSVSEFHAANLLGSAVNGDVSYSEWELDATYKERGRMKLTQVAARRWKDGKIVHERFYYSA